MVYSYQITGPRRWISW